MMAYADETTGLKKMWRQIVTSASEAETSTKSKLLSGTKSLKKRATSSDAWEETEEAEESTKKATPTDAKKPTDVKKPVETEEPTKKATPSDAEKPTDEDEEQVFKYKKSGIQVEVSLSSFIDEDAKLSVTELEPDSFDNEAFTAWVEDQTVFGSLIYDIHLSDEDGNKIEVGEADVKIKLSEIAVPEVEGTETTLAFLHVTDDGTIEEGTVDEDGTTAEITADGFSPFIFVRISSSDNTVLPIEANTFDVGNAQELKDAVESINEGEESYTINITDDINVDSTLQIKKNTVTIVGNGHTLDFGDLESAIVVNRDSSDSSGDGPVLILGNEEDKSNILTLKTNGNVRDDGDHFIVVGDTSGTKNGNGTLKMYDGVTIKDAYANNTFGGGGISLWWW